MCLLTLQTLVKYESIKYKWKNFWLFSPFGVPSGVPGEGLFPQSPDFLPTQNTDLF